MRNRINQTRKELVKEVALCGLATSVLFNSLRAFSYANKMNSLESIMENPLAILTSYAIPSSMVMCLGLSLYNRAFSHVFADDISANKIFFYSAASIYGITSLVNSIYNAHSPVSSNIMFSMFVATLLVTGKEVVSKLLNEDQIPNANNARTHASA